MSRWELVALQGGVMSFDVAIILCRSKPTGSLVAYSLAHHLPLLVSH